LNVGRIHEDVTTTQGQSRWLWAINGVHAHAGSSVMQITGRAATLDAAKDAMRANWEKWLAWAKLAELP